MVHTCHTQSGQAAPGSQDFKTGVTGKEAGWVCGGANSPESDVCFIGARQGLLASKVDLPLAFGEGYSLGGDYHHQMGFSVPRDNCRR